MDEQEIRYELLKLLEQNPNIGQRAMARHMGISLGKTNFCLKALVQKGFIKVQNFSRSENKTAYTYLLTSTGISEKYRLAKCFLNIKRAEYELLETQIKQLSTELRKSAH